MATIAEIKEILGIKSLPLNSVRTATGERTSWFKYWNNEERIAVLVHKDTLDRIKSGDPVILGVNTQIKQGAQGEYVAKTIVLYKEAEETL